MELRIKTLTPLWTGNIKRECKKIRETSIIGSLRWWFEAIVRGFGCYACDPTSNNKCEYRGNLSNICPVCELFGCTGWAKKFKFEVNQKFNSVYDNAPIIGIDGSRWYYPSGLISCGGPLNELEQVFSFDTDVTSIIRVILTFVSNWGMIGGKTAMGYGVVKFGDERGTTVKPDEHDIKIFFDYLKERRNHGKSAVNAPNLSEMFFVKFKINEKFIDEIIEKVGGNVSISPPRQILKCNGAKERVSTTEEFLQRLKDYYGFIPTSALIRKELRGKIRENWNNKNLRHFLMGELGKFSAIQVSHTYWNGKCWELRIWGWIPKNVGQRLNIKIERSKIVDEIKQVFNDKQFWCDCLGSFCFFQKAKDGQTVVEYPKDGWNFIDLGKLKNEEIEKAFKEMISGD